MTESFRTSYFLIYTTLWHEKIYLFNSRIGDCYRQCNFTTYRDEFTKYVIHFLTLGEEIAR